MAEVYYVYLNTMIFAILSGIVSVILLLALVFVPATAAYGPLIMTVQIGLIAIILAALLRIWWTWSRLHQENGVDVRNVMAVGSCPDYMVAKSEGASGGTMCYNNYEGVDGGISAIWTGTPGNNTAPASVDLSMLDKKPFQDVCVAVASDDPDPGLLNSAVDTVPWTEVVARCRTFGKQQP